MWRSNRRPSPTCWGSSIRIRPLAAFFPLTFLVSWIAWFGAAAIPAEFPVRQVIILAGVFAPAIVGLALSARTEGPDAAWGLVRQIGRWRVATRWYLFAIGYMAAVKLATAAAFRMVTGAWPRFGDTPWWIMLLALVTSTWAQAGEEIGWRAYALPRLAAQLGLAPASIVLGAIWAVWHLPLFFILGGDTVGQSFPLYFLQVTALSVAMAWLYWQTSGSLLLAMLMHAAINNTKDIVPSAGAPAASPFTLNGTTQGWLTVLFLWVVAAFLLTRMRHERPHPGESRSVQSVN